MSVLMLVVLVGLVGSISAQYITVQTKYGPVIGRNHGGVDEWLGVPFAAPPVGDLRFAMPQPPVPWTTPRNCTALPDACPQGHYLRKDYFGSEDCLFLDIYRPLGASETSNLPVMVYIHGGGFVEGDAYQGFNLTWGLYNGTHLAEQHNVVVVSIQYRLNIFGFLALNELKDENIYHTTGNYALQDQRLALQWVQDNIGNFGGDKTRVMIFGESAGGASVCYHLTSPASAGLFHAALAESPVCSDSGFFTDYERAVNLGNAFVKHIKCGNDSLFSLECLRKMSTGEILNHILTFPGKIDVPAGTPLPLLGPIFPWTPVVDQSEVGVLDRPLNLVKKGIFNRVPTVLGTNQNEGSIFVPVMDLVVPGIFPLNDTGLEELLLHFINASAAQLVMNTYPLSLYRNQEERAGMILRDYYLACPSRAMIHGMRAVEPTLPTYIYRFNITIHSPYYDVLGDFHMSELVFVFNWKDMYWREEDYLLSAQMGCYWSNFAATGDPNSNSTCAPDMITWEQNSGVDGDFNIALDAPLRMQQGLSDSFCNMWDSIGYN